MFCKESPREKGAAIVNHAVAVNSGPIPAWFTCLLSRRTQTKKGDGHVILESEKTSHRTMLPWPPEGDHGSSEMVDDYVAKVSALDNVLQTMQGLVIVLCTKEVIEGSDVCNENIVRFQTVFFRTRGICMKRIRK